MQTALVTGGGSGIGQALALKLAENKIKVYIVGRDLDKLHQTRQQSPQQINIIQADIKTNRGRNTIKQHLPGVELDYLVHNAGLINNICSFDKIELKQWQEMQKTNVEAPMFLTQRLLGNLKSGSRVLNISSGAAHNPYTGMLLYGMSKAALHLLYRGLNLELNESGILVGSFMPGVVDTELMAKLRKPAKAEFSRVEFYRELYQKGKLRTPTTVAQILVKFLQNTSDEIFTSKDWRIEEFEQIL